jgi:hypothetical protein
MTKTTKRFMKPYASKGGRPDLQAGLKMEKERNMIEIMI